MIILFKLSNNNVNRKRKELREKYKALFSGEFKQQKRSQWQ
jgi:ribosomal protein S17E